MNDAPAERGDESTWARLRRRKVVQWGLVYVAGAWALLQGVDFLADAFEWPNHSKRIATLVALIGLPIALVLAWYHGDRGEQRVRGPELATVALLLLLGGGALWYYQRANDTPASVDTAAPSAATTTPESTPVPDVKSIAVLPFADMSPQKDQEYMSDGIAEELLNLLAKAPDLKVIARTSSFAFKGEKIDIAEIARRLNVAHVLEGSVRKSGNKVRITAQLIRTSDSTHLWSATYDRALDDIFVIQDEIADAIVQALQIKLMGGAVERREGGTQSLEAYESYLQAGVARKQYTETSLKIANEHLDRAIKLDPGFALAWDALAVVVMNKTDQYFLPAAEGYARAEQLAQHASKLSPGLAGPHVTLQGIYMGYWDWAAAEIEGQRALALAPSDPSALQISAMLSSTFGRWEEAEKNIFAALERDPVNAFHWFTLGRVYYGAGQYAASERMYRKALEIAPEFLTGKAFLGKTLLVAGNRDAALAMVQKEADEASRLLYLPAVLWAAGRNAEADKALEMLIAGWGDKAAFYVAQNYAFRGEHELAFQWLDRAHRQRDPWMLEITGEHLFDSMATDPRFKAFLHKMKLPEWPSQTIAAGT